MVSDKVRVQLDLPRGEATALDRIRDACDLRSRADVVRTALAIVEWVQLESARGRRIVSVGEDNISCLTVPGLTASLHADLGTSSKGATNEHST